MLPICRRLIPSILIVLSTVCFPEMAYAEEVRPNLYNQIEALQDLLRLVDRYYYEETDNMSLYHGAIAGYLSKLDPHSTYISPKELQDAQEKMWGSFEGIGIYFAVVDNFLTVLSPIEGSPAYRVGLLPGDRIVKIDGRSVVGIKELEVMRKLKGKKGSRVQVTVRREGEEAFLEFEIVRDKIEVPSVPYAFIIAPDVGYVKVNRFSGHTSEELRVAVGGLLNEGSTKFILDLRGNAGGYLEQAVAVADQFIEKGRLLVYTEGRHPCSREEHRSEHDPVIPPDMPLVILVNSYSASASEIVAGAVQDHDRGLIVGHTTFGKGLVQKQYPLKNGGAVLLTIARYFTPSDRPIQRPFSEDRTLYLEEAHDDYDPNIDPDTLAAKPIYYTRILHRKVFGSGGITPDVTLQRDSLSVFKRRLLAGRHFLEFVSRQASELAREYSEFGAFYDGYQPGRREVSAFKKYLKDKGVAFTDREFKASAEFIKGEVKREIAQIRWGRKAEGQVRTYQDSQVVRALAVFDRAEALLASRAYHYNRGRTQAPAPGDSRDRQMR